MLGQFDSGMELLKQHQMKVFDGVYEGDRTHNMYQEKQHRSGMVTALANSGYNAVNQIRAKGV